MDQNPLLETINKAAQSIMPSWVSWLIGIIAASMSALAYIHSNFVTIREKDMVEKRLDRIETKTDRIETKLDTLITIQKD